MEMDLSKLKVPDRDEKKLCPQFLATINAAMADVKDRYGVELFIFEAWRSEERQTYLWSLGRTRPGKIVTNARPGQSSHQWGLGCDLVAKVNGEWSWDCEEVPYGKFLEIYRSHGLRSLAPRELVHVEYTAPFRAVELADFVRIHGLEELWRKVYTR